MRSDAISLDFCEEKKTYKDWRHFRLFSISEKVVATKRLFWRKNNNLSTRDERGGDSEADRGETLAVIDERNLFFSFPLPIPLKQNAKKSSSPFT